MVMRLTDITNGFWLVWRSGNGGHINEVKLRWTLLVLVWIFGECTIPVFSGPLGLSIHLWLVQWVPAVVSGSAGGRNGESCVAVVLRTGLHWHTGWSRLKALAVHLSQPSGLIGFYDSLIGSEPRQLKALYRGRLSVSKSFSCLFLSVEYVDV